MQMQKHADAKNTVSSQQKMLLVNNFRVFSSVVQKRGIKISC